MAQVYEALGKQIVLDAIVRASDVNAIEDAIVRELTRRNITRTNVQATAEQPITLAPFTSIHTNCVNAGLQGVGAPTAETILSAGQMKKYIDFIKGLYVQIVVH